MVSTGLRRAVARESTGAVQLEFSMTMRSLIGAVAALALTVPAAAETLNPEQARQFIAGKMFAFTCFDGSKGAGRIHHDGSVAGSIQFSGQGPVRYARLPVNTIQVKPNAVCASIKGIPFEPCFNLEKTDPASFRGSVSGMGFAYCDFRKHGNQILATRSEKPRSLRARLARAEAPRSEAPRTEGVSRVEAAPTGSVRAEPLPELRKSTD